MRKSVMTSGDNRFAGRRLGPYELHDAIGAGGMGEVYRASRVDAEYQQQVAIKLVRAGFDISFISARLRAERQILATLEHPNIARLLDGGTTGDGVPYLVMELVDGVPIDRYCEQRRLDIPARLKLFAEVCSAVQYAHRHMVIHRDLKPRNILVTHEGVPKLLDFGIAKILEPGTPANTGDVTLNAQRLLTPGYASPEQLRGELITSASDVYSLGVILYELLTGANPYVGATHNPTEVLRAQQEGEPPKPSRMTQRRIGTDLDNIVLMALRREPERRYATVEQFAEDIRRYQMRLPVVAQRDTFLYRSSVFVRRHTLAAVSAVVVSVLLVGGIIFTSHEARVAEAQRIRAERRFDEVRKLANSLIFDIHDSIRFLPGAAESRHLLANTAVKYLDSLAQDAGNDPALQLELAAAYERLGDVQGQALEVNQGDYAGAMQSYERALALRSAVLASAPHDTTARRDTLVSYGKLSDLAWNSGDPGRALAFSQQTIANAEQLVAADGTNKVYQRLLAASLEDYGFKLFKIRGDTVAALPYMRRSIASLEALQTADPGSVGVGRTLALTYGRTAEMLSDNTGHLEEALSLNQKAQEILAPLVAKSPENADLRHLLAFTDVHLGEVLLRMDRQASAAQRAQAALDAFRVLQAADPKVAEYPFDAGMALGILADVAERRGDPDRAIALLQTALDAMAADSGPANASVHFAAAHAESLYASAFAMRARDVHHNPIEREKDWQSAREAYGKALRMFEEILPSLAEAADEARLVSGEIQQCDRALALNVRQ
jgi:eukaryotic-like serine/threonine-protein kinase